MTAPTRKRTRRLAPRPELIPFLDSVAELLAARVLRELDERTTKRQRPEKRNGRPR